MRSFMSVCRILAIAAVVGGCASAEKRLNQGSELEARGQYESAALRYVQALEKDPGLEEARIRLLETGNLAVAAYLADAEAWASRGEPLRTASSYRHADGMVSRAQGVGVRLDLPAEYGAQRRVVFDDALAALLEYGITARGQGRWQESLEACHQAQIEFEPSVEQRHRALAEEAILYVTWSESEHDQGHWRSAFEVAARVQQMEWSPANQSARAAVLMEDCLAEGQVELIVLPVQGPAGSRRQHSQDSELAAQIEAALRYGPWRQPPAFVSVNEPLAASDLVRSTGILNRGFDVGTLVLILRLAEADYGAHLQLLGSETSEFDVRSRTHSVKTRSGQPATIVQEDGQRRLQATARVVVADHLGNTVADVTVAGSGTAPFSRGVFAGDPRGLNLNAQQVDLFNGIELSRQEQAVREALVRDLATRIAGAVFQPTLAQIP